MAVHATVLQLLVVAQGVHIEVLQTALLDLDLVPYFVVRLDEAIGKIRIDLILDHLPLERLVFSPLSIDEGSNGDGQRLASRLLHQRLPIVDIEHSLVAFGIQRQFANPYLDSLATLVADQEVQRSNVLRDGDVAIIRIDRGQIAAFLHVFRGWRASNEEVRGKK